MINEHTYIIFFIYEMLQLFSKQFVTNLAKLLPVTLSMEEQNVKNSIQRLNDKLNCKNFLNEIILLHLYSITFSYFKY
jgi:hypothetical protein